VARVVPWSGSETTAISGWPYLLDKADFMAPNHSGRDLRYRVEGFPANHTRAMEKDAPTGVLLRGDERL
jgi:hypothetical protein